MNIVKRFFLKRKMQACEKVLANIKRKGTAYRYTEIIEDCRSLSTHIDKHLIDELWSMSKANIFEVSVSVPEIRSFCLLILASLDSIKKNGFVRKILDDDPKTVRLGEFVVRDGHHMLAPLVSITMLEEYSEEFFAEVENAIAKFPNQEYEIVNYYIGYALSILSILTGLLELQITLLDAS
jgi:hypothetical protein